MLLNSTKGESSVLCGTQTAMTPPLPLFGGSYWKVISMKISFIELTF